MRRGTQQHEQIKAAKRAYILTLSQPKDSMSTARYQVYLDDGNGLEVLWPSDSHLGKASKELFGSQVYSKRATLPAYHFALSGCGFSKVYQIKIELQQFNKDLEVLTLSGWSPGNH